MNIGGMYGAGGSDTRDLTEEEKKIQESGDIGQGTRLTDKKRAAAERRGR